MHAPSLAQASPRSAPSFSVLVLSRHGCDALLPSLRSVRGQTFRDYEIVVVDTSAEDVTDAVDAVMPRAKLMRLGRLVDAARARNAALAAASGRYIAFLDSTDVWHPNYLQYHYAANQAMPNALFSFANYFIESPVRSGPVRQLVPEPQADNALLHMVMRPFVHTMSSFVAPRDDVVALKGFHADHGRYAEIDLCARLLAGRPGRKSLTCLARPALNVPQVLVVKNLTGDAKSLDDEIDEWEAQRNDFIEKLFARPIMAQFADRKQLCQASLARSQRAHFSAFLTDRVFPANNVVELSVARIEHAVKAGPLGKPARRARLASDPSTRIAMIHHGRCGSQVLGDMLNQHSQILWEGEIFESFMNKLPKHPVPHLRSRLRACKKPMYGFETKHYHPDLMGVAWVAYLANLEKLGFRKFILQRRVNLLRAVVSALVGIAKGNVYHLPAGTTASLRKVRLDPQAVHFDVEPFKLLDVLRFRTERLDVARRQLDGHDVLCLTYEEDICEDPSRAYRRVCELLEVEPEPVKIKSSRTTPFPLSEVIENFEEVQAALAGTEFEWMLAE